MSKKFQKILPVLIGKQIRLRSLWNAEKATRQAFNLFCSPQKGRVLQHEANFLDPAKNKRVLTNGHKIQTYHWPGSGKTVLLVHGWESNSFRWKSLIEALQKKNYNIIAVDSPGQGYSSGKFLNVPLYTDCIKDIIEAERPEIIIGHSLGGMTAIYHQFKYANPSIKKIVVLGPPSELKFFMKGFQDTLQLSNKFMGKMDDYLYSRFGFYAKEFSIAEFAKSLKVPGLVILEKKDKLAPYKYSKKIADNWKDGELYTVEDVGHSLQSEEINKKILEYIKN